MDRQVCMGATRQHESRTHCHLPATPLRSLSRSDPGTAPPALPTADAFQPCTSPARLSNLTDGTYVFAGARWGEAARAGAATAPCPLQRLPQPSAAAPRLPHAVPPCPPLLPPPPAYAVDPVGNKGQPAAANFTVDTTPPTFTTLE